MTLGIIEEGKLKGKKFIIEPRTGLPENIYLVEKGLFFNGQPMFHKACLNRGCEEYVGEKCDKCNAN